MSVNELHSWIGLLFGCLLFTVFLTGTLTVFDNEITDWMQQPEYVRLSSDARELDGASPSVTAVGRQTGYLTGDASIGRPPLLLVKLQKNRSFTGQTIDPDTGEMVTFRNTQGGDFFYHFHHGLLLGFPGAWIVGTAGMGMLVTLVTGVGIHRRGLKDVLVFWPRFSHQRAWLDTHNLTGIVVFPFHLMITFTGLMIFWSIYMPVDIPLLRESEGLLSLLSVLHFAQFGGSPIRWLYFIMGLAASVMIATRLVFWTIKRQKSLEGRSTGMGYRIVEILNVATVAGLLVAIAAFFWANRLLPIALSERSLWEIRCFFIVWGLCLAHSFFRRCSITAWRDQLYGSAFLLGFLPLLNGLTTNSHLLMTLPKGQWAMAGVDLTGLALGVLLGLTARRVGYRVKDVTTRLSRVSDM